MKNGAAIKKKGDKKSSMKKKGSPSRPPVKRVVASPIQSLKFSLIYCDDLRASQLFYKKYFGFKKISKFGDGSLWGKTGEVGMWLGSGFKAVSDGEKRCRATVMFWVDSSDALYRKLARGKVDLLQPAPQCMGDEMYWFQFRDPSGNIVDILGPL